MNTQRNVKTNRRESFRRCSLRNIENYELSRIFKIHHEKLERLKIFNQKKVEEELENYHHERQSFFFIFFFLQTTNFYTYEY